MRHSIFIPLALCVASARCAADAPVPDDAATYTVRDSAGIEIVESTRAQWRDGQQWTVSDTALVQIGEEDGDARYLLDGVAGAVRLSDGRIVIANAGSGELRFYDGEGRFLHASGRKGRGPGEYVRIDQLVRMPGDSLMVWDATNEVSIVAPDGAFVRRRRIDMDRVMRTITMQRATESLTPMPDGSFIIHAMQRGDPPTRGVPPGVVYRSEIGYFHFRVDGGVDSLGWYPGGLPQMYLNIGGRPVYETMLLAWHARLAVGAPSRVFITLGDPYEVMEFTDGRLVRIIRRSAPPVPIPPEEIRRFREARDQRGERSRRVREALPEQTHYPAILRMTVDADGYLWVRTYGEATQVFDHAGAWLGDMDPPGSVLEIGREHVLVRLMDALGVERVSLHTLRR
ncbi:MAG TPA: hypothetical protein VMN60_05225 [Longimicrobiales bacterium]|nr:hypothetical protein [Longimicrobiales bacterium]